MGGFGSGRWKNHAKKILVEDCLSLDVARFAREGIIGTRNTSKSSLQWSDMSTRKGVAVGFTYSFEFKKRGASLLRLRYTIGRENQREVVNMSILLKKTRPHFGGFRWWFRCPLVNGGRPCRRRVQKLYLPPNSNYWGCRHCHDLAYQKSTESGKYERLYTMAPW